MTAIPTANGPANPAPIVNNFRRRTNVHEASKIEGLIRILDKSINFSDIEIGKTTTALNGPLSFGRSSDADFNIRNNDKTISRRHFQLRRLSNGGHQIMDLGSSHGTFKLDKTLKTIRKIKPMSWMNIDELSPLKIGGGNTWLILKNNEYFICNVKLESEHPRKTYRPYAFDSFEINKPQKTRRSSRFSEPLNMPGGSGPYNIQSTKAANRTSKPINASSTRRQAPVFKKGEIVNFKGDFQIKMISDGFFQYTSGTIVFDSKYITLSLNQRDQDSIERWIIYFISDRSQPDHKFKVAMSVLKDSELEAAHQLVISELDLAQKRKDLGKVEKFKALNEIIHQIYETRQRR